MTVSDDSVPLTPPPVAQIRDHAGIEKIQAAMKKCADGIAHVSELAAHVESQGGWDGLATTREHMRLLASNLTTVAAVQQRTLELIVMLLGMAGRIKEHYTAILDSIDETRAAHPDSPEVAEYLTKLRATLNQIKEQDERLESIALFTTELRTTIENLALSISSQSAEDRQRFTDLSQGHKELQDHLREKFVALARANDDLKGELSHHVSALETAIESLAERQRSGAGQILGLLEAEKGERDALRSDLHHTHAGERAALEALRKETEEKRSAALAAIQQKFETVQKTLEQKIDLIHSYTQNEMQGAHARLAEALAQEKEERRHVLDAVTQGGAKTGGDLRASFTREIALAEERLRRNFEELYAIMEDRVQSSLQQVSESLAQETSARAGALGLFREELEARFQEQHSSLNEQLTARDSRLRQERQTLESAADSRFRALEERLGHALQSEFAVAFDGKLEEQSAETERLLAENTAQSDVRLQSSLQALEERLGRTFQTGLAAKFEAKLAEQREETTRRLAENASQSDVRLQASLQALRRALEEETCVRQQTHDALRDDLLKRLGESSEERSSGIEQRLADLSTRLDDAFSEETARRDAFMAEVAEKFEQARRQHTADLAAVLQREREVQTTRADELQKDVQRQEEAWRDQLYAIKMQQQATVRWGMLFLGAIGVSLLVYVLRGL